MDNLTLIESFVGVLESAVETGGFSVDLQGNSPTHGYMVALPNHERIVPIDNSMRSSILAYVTEFIDVLSAAPLYVGGWVNEGQLYLDLSQNVTDYRRAAILGMQRQQIAIWDVANTREIRLAA